MAKPISRATSTWGVMRSAWAVCRRLESEGNRRGATVEEVRDHLLTHRGEPIEYRTVATHLRTLEAKQLLYSRRNGRKLYYRPVVDELVVVSGEIRVFLDNVIHYEPALLDELERQLLEDRYEADRRRRHRQKPRSQAT